MGIEPTRAARVALIALGLAALGAIARADVVCRLDHITGFEDVFDDAHTALGEATTSEPEGAKIFITVKGPALYVHSNFMTPGYEYPTKMAIESDAPPLDVIVGNILYKDLSQASQDEIRRLAKDNIAFYVERFKLKGSKYDRLLPYLKTCKHVTYLGEPMDPPAGEASAGAGGGAGSGGLSSDGKPVFQIGPSRSTFKKEIAQKSGKTLVLFNVYREKAGLELEFPDASIHLTSVEVDQLKRGTAVPPEHALSKRLAAAGEAKVSLHKNAAIAKDAPLLKEAMELISGLKKAYPKAKIDAPPPPK